MTKVLRKDGRHRRRAEAHDRHGGSLVSVPADSVFDRIELGELAETGDTCPCSGWWEARPDSHTTPRRRFILRGQALPPVTRIASTWSRLMPWRRKAVPAIWRLVQYDNADTIPMPVLDEVLP